MLIANGARGVRHVFLRDLVLEASIGIHPHEHASRQRLRINVDLGVRESGPFADRLDSVVDYELVANRVRDVVHAAHTNLVETVAERIAAVCLLDARVVLARIRVEKLDVFADSAAAGVEIERLRPASRPPTVETC